MARSETTTLDGIEVGYGSRNSANPEAGEVHTLGRRHEVHVNLDYRAMPTGQTVAASVKNARIPLGSVVRNARLAVDEVFVGATTISVGLREFDGTAVGAATSIFNAASLATVDNIVADDLDVEVAADATIAVVTDAPATAGRGVLTIVYDSNPPHSVEPAVITGIIGSL